MSWGVFPASPSPPAEHGVDTKPNASKCCNLARKRKTPFLSSSDFLLHSGSEEVERKCLVDHTHSAFDKASFCKSVHYLRNAFNQNSWKYFCHQHWLRTKSGTELHFMTLPGSDYVFSDWLKCGVNPLKLMINWSQSYSSPSHYFDFALAQRGTKQSVTDFANLKMNQRPNCSFCLLHHCLHMKPQ